MNIRNKICVAMLIFLFALAVRLIFFLCFWANDPNVFTSDPLLYHTLGQNIASGLGYVGLDGSPNFYRVPGYPLFLAFCYKLFHYKIFCMRIMHIVWGAFVPVFIYFLSCLLLPNNFLCAVIAGIAACLHVGLILFSCLVGSDLLFLFFFLLFLLLFFLAVKHNRRFLFFAAGLGLGVASLVRPMGLPLLLVVTLILFFDKKAFSAFGLRSCLVWMGWICAVGPWLLRNFLLTGFLFFHTLAGTHFFSYFMIPVKAKAAGISYAESERIVSGECQVALAQAEQHVGRKFLEIEHAQLVEHLAVKIGLANPWCSLKYVVENMAKTCFSLYSAVLLIVDSGGVSDNFDVNRSFKGMLMRFLQPKLHDKRIQYVIWWEILFNLMVFIGICGFIVCSLLRRKYNFLLISFLLFSLLFVGISFGCGYARFRLPLEPFLIIFSSVFWVGCLQKRGCL